MHPPNPCSGVPSKNVKLCLEIKRLGKTKPTTVEVAGISPSRWKGDSQLYELQLLLKRLALKLHLIPAHRMNLRQRTSTEVRRILGLESRIGGVFLSRYSLLEYGINMELRTLFLY